VRVWLQLLARTVEIGRAAPARAALIEAPRRDGRFGARSYGVL
jgi:hypothetical protein